ncbi:hypothetical protein GF312_10615 [Candidatus Poribacteria bacterium]|nr:hypothetical protein [Candidatus Poribacteria bacterium]
MRYLLILTICIFIISISTGFIYGAEEDMENFFQTVANPSRNNYSGLTGIEVTMNDETFALALGRPVTTTFEQEHTVTVWSTETQEVIAEAVVGPDSPTFEVENGIYVYEMLENPLKLEAGKTYRIMCEEFAGGDNWATVYMVTPGEDITDVASINGVPWGPTGQYPTNFDATPNKVDIGCTFFYGNPTQAVDYFDKLHTTWAKLKL